MIEIIVRRVGAYIITDPSVWLHADGVNEETTISARDRETMRLAREDIKRLEAEAFDGGAHGGDRRSVLRDTTGNTVCNKAGHPVHKSGRGRRNGGRKVRRFSRNESSRFAA